MTTKVHGSLIDSAGMSMVVGCDCKNNSGTPNTQFDLDCDAVVLRDSSGSTVTRYNPGAAITNNISTAGPAANGRDQSGAFSNSSWVHFYWIWNGTTLATVSSTVAPPTGPTLPTGYTHWAYCGAVYFNGSSNLVRTVIRGSLATREFVSVNETNFSATDERTHDLSAIIPPNALAVYLSVSVNLAAANEFYKIRSQTGVDSGFEIESCAAGIHGVTLLFPVVSQTVYDLHSHGNGTRANRVHAFGYKIPNGDS